MCRAAALHVEAMGPVNNSIDTDKWENSFMKISCVSCVLTLLILVVTAAYGQTRKTYDPKGSLADAERAFAQMSLDVGQKEAFIEYLGDWGMMFGPDPISAKANFANEPATQLPQSRVLYWEPYYGDTSVADDMGFNIGPWVVRETGTEKILGQGYFLSVWKRAPDRTWREYVDMGVRVPVQTTDHNFGGEFESARAIPARSRTTSKNLSSAGDLERKLSELSKSQGTLAAYRKMLDERTAMLRWGVGLLKGKETIADFITSSGFDRLALDLVPIDNDVSRNGDLAYSYGKYQLTSGTELKEKGYYVHVWRRDSKGEWKIAASNLAPLPEYRKDPNKKQGE